MITTLTGNNSFALTRRLNELTGRFVFRYGELGLHKIDAEESNFAVVQEAVQGLPFLSERKMIVVRGLAAKPPDADILEQIISSIGKTTDLIFFEPQIDKRTSYYKTLKAHTRFEQYDELDIPGLAKWLVGEAKDQAANIAPAEAIYLIERLGTDQLMLYSELSKLITYDRQITRRNIELLTEPSPQSKVFDLLDAAFGGRKKQALQLYEEQRALRVEPQQILAMIAWQLQALAVIKAAAGRLPAEIARDAKLNPYVVRKSLTTAKKISDQALAAMVSDALEIDYRSKTTAIELDEALKTFIVAM